MNRGAMKIELRNRLSIAITNTFWTDTMLNSWLEQANQWACAYRKWPFTERAVFTLSRADALFYDYPPQFRVDSIRLLEVRNAAGTIEEYKKIRYPDFMKHIRDNPNSEDRIFSDFRRQYFINPIIRVNGLEISIWGQEKPAPLAADTDTTPFAEGEEMGIEAIIKRAMVPALQKAKKYNEAAIERDEARLILDTIWERVLEEQVSYKSKDAPLFSVPDFLK